MSKIIDLSNNLQRQIGVFTVFDVAVIGGGPAALSAALNLKIRNKNLLVLAGNEKATDLAKAPRVENYLGFNAINGKELLNLFKSHVKDMNIDINSEMAYNILNMDDYYSINAGNNFYDAKSVVIATGRAKDTLLVGEEEYLGRGVGYCATCDGPLYKNKSVAIISENEEGEEEAKFLSEICYSTYYLPLYEAEISEIEGVNLIKGKPISILGNENKVTSLKTTEGIINVDGIFIARNVLPVNQLIEGLDLLDGSIEVDRTMSTNLPGVFACGDCTGKPFQISKAVGEGNVAALSAVRYLDENRR